MKDKLYTFAVGAVMMITALGIMWVLLIVLDRLLKLTPWW